MPPQATCLSISTVTLLFLLVSYRRLTAVIPVLPTTILLIPLILPSQPPLVQHERMVLTTSSLSVPSRGKLAPPHPIHQVTRRSVTMSGSNEPPSRSTSRLSTAVSGPLSASIWGSTFASRQRTASLSGSNPSPTPRRPSCAPRRSD
jgi:hypothetical protein